MLTRKEQEVPKTAVTLPEDVSELKFMVTKSLSLVPSLFVSVELRCVFLIHSSLFNFSIRKNNYVMLINYHELLYDYVKLLLFYH
jgi:hypothetical protein